MPCARPGSNVAQAVCDKWSAQLRGQRFKPRCLYHVQACALGCVSAALFGGAAWAPWLGALPACVSPHAPALAQLCCRLRGRLASRAPDRPALPRVRLCLLQEHTFTTVEGARVALPFAGGGS